MDGDRATDLITADLATSTATVLRGQGWLPYGTGTSGCAGALGVAASTSPRIGTQRFGVLGSNAPPAAAGGLVLADRADLFGTELPGLGLRLHVGLASPFLVTLGVASDVSGSSFAPLPIPAQPSLIGVRIRAQTIWVESAAAGRACGRALLGLVGSRGLALTFQP